MRKAASPVGLVLASGIAGLAAGALHLKLSTAIVIGLVLVVGVIAFNKVSADQLAVFAVGFLALTITWNGIRVGGGAANATNGISGGGGALGDAGMVIAFIGTLTYVIARKRSVPLPPWLLAAAFGWLLAEVVNIIFPPSVAVMQHAALTQATIGQQSGGIPGHVGALGVGADAVVLFEIELALLLIPVMLATVGTTVRRCRLFVDLFVLGAAVNAAAGFLDLAGIHLGVARPGAGRAAGLTLHPNYLALTCVIALPMAMLWFGRSRRWNVAGVIGVGLLLGGVYASGSRAGFVSAGIALVATVAFVPRLRRTLPYLLPIVGAGLVVLLAFTSTGHKLLVQFRLANSGTSSAGGSDQQRALLAHTAWSQIQVRPFSGVGWAVLTGAHDIYLELLDAGGAIAMAAFLAFIGGLVASLRRALSGPLKDEAIVCGIGVLAWLANGVFDNQVGDKYLYLVPGLLVAIGRTTWLLQQKPARLAPSAESGLALRPARPLVGVGAR